MQLLLLVGAVLGGLVAALLAAGALLALVMHWLSRSRPRP